MRQELIVLVNLKLLHLHMCQNHYLKVIRLLKITQVLKIVQMRLYQQVHMILRLNQRIIQLLKAIQFLILLVLVNLN